MASEARRSLQDEPRLTSGRSPNFEIVRNAVLVGIAGLVGIVDTADGFDADTVKRVIRLVDLNEYKRRQAPPGVKITRKGFGRDRRLPITNKYLNQ